MNAGYVSTTEGEVALAAAGTAKSVLGVQGTSGFGVDLHGFSVAFDGITAAAEPIVVEICAATFATNPPGTNSTGVAETQKYGRAITPGFVAAKNWTAEPTVLTVIKEFSVDPYKGTFDYDFDPMERPDSPVSEGFVIRLTNPAGTSPNVRAELRYERT